MVEFRLNLLADENFISQGRHSIFQLLGAYPDFSPVFRWPAATPLSCFAGPFRSACAHSHGHLVGHRLHQIEVFRAEGLPATGAEGQRASSLPFTPPAGAGIGLDSYDFTSSCARRGGGNVLATMRTPSRATHPQTATRSQPLDPWASSRDTRPRVQPEPPGCSSATRKLKKQWQSRWFMIRPQDR